MPLCGKLGQSLPEKLIQLHVKRPRRFARP
jgi:hypothetical protein